MQDAVTYATYTQILAAAAVAAFVSSESRSSNGVAPRRPANPAQTKVFVVGMGLSIRPRAVRRRLVD